VLPSVEDIDLLVILGGPMSVNDEADLTWLVAEKRFIRQAIEKEKAVVGICLGAQLIASATGARVYPNKEKEIGWFPVSSALSGGARRLFAFPPQSLVFHWHGETFDLPSGAVRLARSIACENQAFQLGRRVIGLQFHLETTPESARDIVRNCRADLAPSRYVQSEAEILRVDPSTYGTINALMGEVLHFVTSHEG
jgi:GMP synthase-like glutamine amidotransferase